MPGKILITSLLISFNVFAGKVEFKRNGKVTFHEGDGSKIQLMDNFSCTAKDEISKGTRYVSLVCNIHGYEIMDIASCPGNAVNAASIDITLKGESRYTTVNHHCNGLSIL